MDFSVRNSDTLLKYTGKYPGEGSGGAGEEVICLSLAFIEYVEVDISVQRGGRAISGAFAAGRPDISGPGRQWGLCWAIYNVHAQTGNRLLHFP